MIFALVGDNGVRQVSLERDGEAAAVTGAATGTGTATGTGESFVLRDGQDPPLRVNAAALGPGRWSLLVGPRSLEARVRRQGTVYTVEIEGGTFTFDLTDPARAALRSGRGGAHGPGRITAPMPGRVLRLLVAAGQKVQRGDPVAVVEAMKMENELPAPRDGVVAEILVAEGETVEGGAALVVIGDP